MKLKEIKDYIQDTVYKIDKDFANVTYFLIKNGFSGKKLHQIDEVDILIMFDNLRINSEIIDSDNISEYDVEKIIEKAGKIRVNKIKKDPSLFLVLNYYNAHGVSKECAFVFKYGHDVITEKKGE